MKILVVLVLAVGACESSPAKAPADLAVVAPADLASSSDLSVAPFDCAELHTCIVDCESAPAQTTCASGCESAATPSAQNGYQMVLDCAATACTVDGGSGCSAAEAAIIKNPSGDDSTISDACGTCIDTAAAAGGKCAAEAASCFQGTG